MNAASRALWNPIVAKEYRTRMRTWRSPLARHDGESRTVWPIDLWFRQFGSNMLTWRSEML